MGAEMRPWQPEVVALYVAFGVSLFTWTQPLLLFGSSILMLRSGPDLRFAAPSQQG